MAADLTRVFGQRFVALIAYGPATSVAFASDIRAGVTARGRGTDLPTLGERDIGMPATLVGAAPGRELHHHGRAALVRRLPAYLAAAERLWRFVDGGRQRCQRPASGCSAPSRLF